MVISPDAQKSAALTTEIEDIVEAQSADCAVIILQGKEGEEIIKFIKEGSVELMVMGAYGHNRLRELLLGSTTSLVLRKSHIPVLLTH